MTVTIRPASAAHQPAIAAIIRAARINPLGLNWPRFLVAEESGGLIGASGGRVTLRAPCIADQH